MSDGPDQPDPDQPDELARSVARLIAWADQCDADRLELHANIRELAGMVTELAANRARTGTPYSWLDPATWPEGGADHATVLVELVAWVERVYLRYPGANLPSCWMWHPGVVEELLVLWRVWQDAHHAKAGSWTRVAEWHQTLRPGVAKRLKESPAGSCDLIKHANGNRPVDSEPTPAPLAGYAALVADAWERDGLLPEPTAAMLAEADLLVTQPTSRRGA